MNFLTSSKYIFTSVLITLPIAACGGSEASHGSGGDSCVNGATAQCTCDAGNSGAQLCVEGTWTACDCSGTSGSGGSTTVGNGGSTSVSLCGNGVVDANEMCDTTVGSETCASLTMNAQPNGTLLCSSSCTYDTSQCSSVLGTGGTTGSGGMTGGGGTTSGGGTSGFGGRTGGGGGGF